MAKVVQVVGFQFVLVIFGLVAISCRKICPDGCVCTDQRTRCKCLPGRGMMLDSSLQVHTKYFFITDCDRVEVQPGVFNHMDLSLVLFDRIKVLQLRNFAVLTKGNIELFAINDVSDLLLEPFSISVKNLKQFQLLNLTASSVPENAISVDESEVSVIVNCHFDHFHTRSVVMRNVDKAFLQGSTFVRIDADAITFKNVKSPKILNSTFHDMNMSSLSLQSIESADFRQNIFRELPTRFLKTDFIDRFNFTENTVGVSRRDAFAGVQLIPDATVNFSANVFHEMEPNSLLPTHSYESLVTVNNSFHCDCHMNWMLVGGALYDALVNSSSCNNHGGKAMSDMLSLYYSGAQCEKIEEEESQGTSEEETQTQNHPTQNSPSNFSPPLTTSFFAAREEF